MGLEIGERALREYLQSIGASLQDIRQLCCVTTTGLLTPGFSSLLVHRLGLRQDCARIDVVGMGCNAGVNGLSAVTNWAAANPGRLAILLCIEICSAAYVHDDGIETAVVRARCASENSSRITLSQYATFDRGRVAVARTSTDMSATTKFRELIEMTKSWMGEVVFHDLVDWNHGLRVVLHHEETGGVHGLPFG